MNGKFFLGGSRFWSGKIDPKLFAKKSKEYSNLGDIISCAREFIKFEFTKNLSLALDLLVKFDNKSFFVINFFADFVY